MSYETYTGLSRSAILEKVRSAMSEKRFTHVLGVEESAMDLARRYGADETKASLAALLHDYAKERPDEDFLSLIDDCDLDLDLKKWGNNIWHGVVGSFIISQDFNLQDDEILRAIERHTVGAAEMSLLDKVLYVADYIEPGRNFPGVDEARRLSQIELDKAVAFETARTVAHLASKAQPIFPQTIETYNAFCKYLKED